MGNMLKNVSYLLPIMFYFMVESIILGIFISFAWRFVLSPVFNVDITYFQWVILIWIIKMVFFDVFKLLAGMAVIETDTKKEEQEEKQY